MDPTSMVETHLRLQGGESTQLQLAGASGLDRADVTLALWRLEDAGVVRHEEVGEEGDPCDGPETVHLVWRLN